ncbi:MAG: LysR family transcriptional regulator (chromosome initiation inhibitor) [Phenylobacterium sp.]|jgi:LysR family transcriptional regulator (chromosome initiation inhibitor)
MARFDYKLLNALNAVMQEQSFERAANHLCISQSAVSQRIKLLEEFVAHPVIVRGQPIVPTAIGQKLLTHYRQVQQLESVLLPELLPDEPTQAVKISVAVNADSVATWFLRAMAVMLKSYPIELNLLISDEIRTIDKLKSGEAYAAVTAQQKALPGYQSFELGKLNYVLVATKEFVQRYFADGINAASLRQAPAVSYDPKDDMHSHFINQHFGLAAGSYPCHTVRSSEAFVELAKQGAAYCLISQLQIADELERGELINILPDKSLNEVLYWHCWVMVSGIYKQVSEHVVKSARALL